MSWKKIQAWPSLWNTAPNSWLSTMLVEWLQWAPGDRKGSTSKSTVEDLKEALNKAGFPHTAQSIDNSEFRILESSTL